MSNDSEGETNESEDDSSFEGFSDDKQMGPDEAKSGEVLSSRSTPKVQTPSKHSNRSPR